jgi:hypothetical protein
MTHWLIWLFPILAAVVWRLGGGALTTLTGFSLGTDFARALRASLALIFVLKFGWFGLLLVPALFLGTVIGGWGAFEAMGLNWLGFEPENSWEGRLPKLLGFKPGDFWFDFFGMAEAGTLCMMPLAFADSCLAQRPEYLLLLIGLGFAPCYALARVIPWKIPRFATGQDWGEVFVGAMLGAVFAWSVTC